MKIKKTISDEKAFSIIHKPVMTEKSTTLNQFNQYSFVVDKTQIPMKLSKQLKKYSKLK